MRYLFLSVIAVIAITSFESYAGEPEDSQEEACSICLKEVENGYNPRLNECKECKKSMGCEDCLGRWFASSRTCPLCREAYSEADISAIMRKNDQVKAEIAQRLAQAHHARGQSNRSGLNEPLVQQLSDTRDSLRREGAPEVIADLEQFQRRLYEDQVRQTYRLPAAQRRELEERLANQAIHEIRRNYRLNPNRELEVLHDEQDRATEAVRQNFRREEGARVRSEEENRILANYQRGIYLLSNEQMAGIRESVMQEMRQEQIRNLQQATRQQNANRRFLGREDVQRIENNVLDQMYHERVREYEMALASKRSEIQSALKWENWKAWLGNGIWGWLSGWYQYHDVLSETQARMVCWIRENPTPVRD